MSDTHSHGSHAHGNEVLEHHTTVKGELLCHFPYAIFFSCVCDDLFELAVIRFYFFRAGCFKLSPFSQFPFFCTCCLPLLEPC